MANILKKVLSKVLLGVNVLHSVKRSPAETLCCSQLLMGVAAVCGVDVELKRLIHNQSVPPSLEGEIQPGTD